MNTIKCTKCNNPFLYVKQTETGLRIYCSKCGKWQKNIDDEIKNKVLEEYCNR